MRSRVLVVCGVLVGLVMLAEGCGSDTSPAPRAEAPRPARVVRPVAHRPQSSQPTYRETLTGVTMAYETILHNLANAHAPGYKAVRPMFFGSDAVPELRRDLSSGWPVPTGRWLDVAINGPGYFAVDAGPNIVHATAYSRVGKLFVNRDNELVLGSANGPRVLPRITFPDEYGQIVIDRSGNVAVTTRDSDELINIGQIELARFANDAGLDFVGNDMFHAGIEAGAPIMGHPAEVGFGYLKQKHLEGSNVDVVAELAELRQLKRWGQNLGDTLKIQTIFDTDEPVAVTLAVPQGSTSALLTTP